MAALKLTQPASARSASARPVQAGQTLPMFAFFLATLLSVGLTLVLLTGQLGYVVRQAQNSADLATRAGAAKLRDSEVGQSAAEAARASNTTARQYLAYGLDPVARYLQPAPWDLSGQSFDGSPVPDMAAQSAAHGHTKVWVVLYTADEACVGAWYFAPGSWEDPGEPVTSDDPCDVLTLPEFPTSEWPVPLPTVSTIYLQVDVPARFSVVVPPGLSPTYPRYSRAVVASQ